MCRLGATRLQVVDQSLPDLVGQRQPQRRVRLRLRDFDGRFRPTKVVQFQRANISRPQSQPAGQQENGVISFAFCRTAIDRTEKSDDEFVIPNRRDSGIPENSNLRQLRTEIFLQNPTHGQKPEKGTDIRYGSRDRLRLQVIPTGHKLGQIQRLNLVQGPPFPGMEKIQKDREFGHTQAKGRRAEVESILTILFVITKGVLQGGKKMNGLHLRECSLNAPVLSKVGQHLDAEFHMPAPALAQLTPLLVPDAILLKEARRQIRGKLISQFLAAGKSDEVFPDGTIPIP